MSAKFTAARRNAFLAALAQSGNQTLAAERAKVSRSWVHLHRSSDPAFRAAMDEAIAAAKARLDAAEARRPEDKDLRWQEGAELVVRGSNGRRTQIARSRIKQWSPRAEQAFLRALASTCNVKAACAQVGLTPASAYAHRQRWPAFMRLWDEAIETGYARIEMALVAAAGHYLSPDEHPPEAPLAGMTVAQAIHILHMHKYVVRGQGRRPGLSAAPPTGAKLEAIFDRIRVKLALVERARQAHEARQARAGERVADAAMGAAAPAQPQICPDTPVP